MTFLSSVPILLIDSSSRNPLAFVSAIAVSPKFAQFDLTPGASGDRGNGNSWFPSTHERHADTAPHNIAAEAYAELTPAQPYTRSPCIAMQHRGLRHRFPNRAAG